MFRDWLTPANKEPKIRIQVLSFQFRILLSKILKHDYPIGRVDNIKANLISNIMRAND